MKMYLRTALGECNGHRGPRQVLSYKEVLNVIGGRIFAVDPQDHVAGIDLLGVVGGAPHDSGFDGRAMNDDTNLRTPTDRYHENEIQFSIY